MEDIITKPKKIMPRRPAKWNQTTITQYLVEQNLPFMLAEQILPAQPSVMKVRWFCSNDVTHEWSATFDSIKTMKSGCPFCAGNIKMTLAELNERISELNTNTIAISIEDSRRSLSGKYAKFNCKKCNHVWNANIHNVLKFSYGCPICNANIAVPNFDNDGNFFHSKLERYCWEKMKECFPTLEITRQHRYLPTRRLSADFYIPSASIIIEVSGRLLIKREKYSSTIEEKRSIAVSQNKTFVVLTNIPEINQYMLSLGDQIK